VYPALLPLMRTQSTELTPPPIYMDSSVSTKDENWFLCVCVCHHVSAGLYCLAMWGCTEIGWQQVRHGLCTGPDVNLVVAGVNGLTPNVAGSQTSYLASSLFVSHISEFVLEALVTNLAQIYRSLSFCFYNLQ
jgi:hypothetical protein